MAVKVGQVADRAVALLLEYVAAKRQRPFGQAVAEAVRQMVGDDPGGYWFRAVAKELKLRALHKAKKEKREAAEAAAQMAANAAMAPKPAPRKWERPLSVPDSAFRDPPPGRQRRRRSDERQTRLPLG